MSRRSFWGDVFKAACGSLEPVEAEKRADAAVAIMDARHAAEDAKERKVAGMTDVADAVWQRRKFSWCRAFNWDGNDLGQGIAEEWAKLTEGQRSDVDAGRGWPRPHDARDSAAEWARLDGARPASRGSAVASDPLLVPLAGAFVEGMKGLSHAVQLAPLLMGYLAYTQSRRGNAAGGEAATAVKVNLGPILGPLADAIGYAAKQPGASEWLAPLHQTLETMGKGKGGQGSDVEQGFAWQRSDREGSRRSDREGSRAAVVDAALADLSRGRQGSDPVLDLVEQVFRQFPWGERRRRDQALEATADEQAGTSPLVDVPGLGKVFVVVPEPKAPPAPAGDIRLPAAEYRRLVELADGAAAAAPLPQTGEVVMSEADYRRLIGNASGTPVPEEGHAHCKAPAGAPDVPSGTPAPIA